MLHRKALHFPKQVYPVDPWRIVEKRFEPHFVQESETIFSLSNGYLGMRGCFEEGVPVFENGTFINGFFEIWPIQYGEKAYGFAQEGQTIVNVSDAKAIKLFVDGEPFVLSSANLSQYERVLDMRSGVLTREIVWVTPSRKQVAIRSSRLVSYQYRHVAAISYEVTVLNDDAFVVISSQVENDVDRRLRSDDPRLHHSFKSRVLVPRLHAGKDRRVILGHETEESHLKVVCGIDHVIEGDLTASVENECSEDRGKVEFSFHAKKGMPCRIAKFIAFHTSDELEFSELTDCAGKSLDQALSEGSEKLMIRQQQCLNDFWSRADVKIEEDLSGREQRRGELQQALRFNLFHIFQASYQTGEKGIPAKGLTGQAYDGNYFWDTDAYVVPFLIYTDPQLARNLLDFRYRMLDDARKRAVEVGEKGALFPWRTIDGKECSGYYAAGTAQYHIDGDIMHSLQKYVAVTGDEDFLFQRGAEMLAETARMWFGLGFFSKRRDGKFCIHGVTGPDEYTTVVNNNLYTNLIARDNLMYAASTLERMKLEREDLYGVLVEKIDLKEDEPGNWKKAAENTYLPFDETLQIHPQDDSFLYKKCWDFKHTPAEMYPLLLHFHPLQIYRQQVIKQADVALAMVLFGDQFSPEQKRRNFDYYDPLTTSDSSLSVCIQSILALETGHMDKALAYADYAILMDLGNVEGNVKDGCHIASLAGSWMLCVYGIAGMRHYDGKLSFHPHLPDAIKCLSFPLTVRGSIMDIDIRPESVTYKLREGGPLTFWHCDEKVSLARGDTKTGRMKACKSGFEAE